MNPLQSAIESADLPGLVAEYFPASGAQSETPNGHIKAVWRGEEHGSASLHQLDNKWLLTDHGAGETYNAFGFLTDVVELTSRQAAEVLITDEAQGTETAYSVHQQYQLTHFPESMLNRGFTMEDLQRLNIVCDGHDALIPIYNHDGAMMNLKRRVYEPIKGKYRYELTGRGAGPWYSPSFDKGDHVLVIEGELNAMIAHLALGPNVAVVGMPGSEKQDLPPDGLDGRAIYIYADSDQPGQKAIAKWAKQAHEAGALQAMSLSPLNQDFCEVAGETGKEDLQKILSRRISSGKKLYGIEDRIVAGTYTIREMQERMERYLLNRVLISTGWPSIDKLTGGLPESGIVHFAALSSMGKSVAVRDVLYHNVEAGKKIMLFSPDQSPMAVFRFIASRRCGIPFKWIRDRFYPPEMLEEYGNEQAIMQAYADCFNDTVMNYSDRFKISEEDEVETVIRAMERGVDQGYELFAGDYIQMFQSDKERSDELAAKAFKKATRRLKVPMIFAVQIAKYKFPYGSRRNPIPQVSDIEGSGSYYQVAEQVYMIYNHDMYWAKYVDPADPPAELHGAHKDAGHVRMIVHKNKDDDAVVDDFRRLRFNKSLVTFEDLS